MRLVELRKYSFRFALRVLAMAASAVTAVLTARLLPPLERGFLALLAVPVTQVAAFAGTGMRQPIAKCTSVESNKSITSGTMLIAAAIGLFAAAGWGGVRTGLLPALAAGALCAAMVLFAFLEALAIASGRMTRVLLGQLAVQTVFLAGAPILYALDVASPIALLSLQVLGFVVTSLGSYRQEIRSVLVVPEFSGQAVGSSVKHALGTVALTLLCRLDVVAAVLVLPEVLLGQYVVASSFGEFLSQFPAFAGFLLFAETPRDVSGKRRILCRIVLRAIALCSITAAVLSLVVPSLVRALLGPEYEAAAHLFAWLLPAYVLGSALRVAAGFIAAVGEIGLIIKISVAGTVAMACLVVSAGPARISAQGIALSAAAAGAVAITMLFAVLFYDARYE